MTSEWINNPQITQITSRGRAIRLGFGYSDAGLTEYQFLICVICG